ncbi:MAG: LysR family transcriptional regulator [Lautropia sp.]|nr:LysR family transcriptional regulator [Lautropia sp.]
MNVTLRQLRAFITLARTGSFTQAAEHLHVTQSALSGLIKELEQALGIRLFDRSTRHTQLSDVGSDIYPLIEQILSELDGVLTEVSNLKALKKGVVRVAAPQLMASTLLPEVIAGFRQLFPDIEIRLLDCAVEGVTTRVLSGDVDIGVGPERELHSDLDSTLLFELPFHVVLPAGHALASRDLIPWAELARLPLITLQGQFTERLSLDLNAAIRELDITPATTVTFMSTALGMVAAGLGVTICMPYAESLVRLYGLTMRPLTSPDVRRRFHLFTRAGRSLSPAAEQFYRHLLDQVRQR